MGGVTINHSNELMVSYSTQSERSVKLANLKSKTVYANFPEPDDQRLKNITSVALSPNSGFLALGNSNGRVLLWRLRHFANY